LKKWYDPKFIRYSWKTVLNYIDDAFRKCKIYVSDELDGFKPSENTIYLSKDNPGVRRVQLMSYLLHFILFTLFPFARVVKYKDDMCILIKMKDIDIHTIDVMKTMNENQKSRNYSKWLTIVNKKYKKPKNDNPEDRARISKKDLSYLYYDKQYDLKQIGEIIGLKISAVSWYMKKYNLPTRSRRVRISPRKLIDLYYEQDFTIKEISKILDVSYKVVERMMDEYGLPRRDSDVMYCRRYYRVRGFESVLRKKLRRNQVYLDVTKKVVEAAETNPDLLDSTLNED